jgi:hypothetical protein
MSDTPTPRTDAVWNEWLRRGDAGRLRDEMAKLERELAAANGERDDALMMLGVYKLGCDAQKEHIRRREEDLNQARAEMRKQLPVVTAIFGEDAWSKAKEARP